MNFFLTHISVYIYTHTNQGLHGVPFAASSRLLFSSFFSFVLRESGVSQVRLGTSEVPLVSSGTSPSCLSLSLPLKPSSSLSLSPSCAEDERVDGVLAAQKP